MTQQIFLGAGRRDHTRAAGVAVIAVEFGRDIDINHIARRDDPGPRHAVGGLLVDADARGARKVVGQAGRGTGAGAVQQTLAELVEFEGGHAGLERGEHAPQHPGCNAADAP